MFKFLLEKFSKIYLNEIRLRKESLFCKIFVAGSRSLSNISVAFVEEFDHDLNLIFFVVWFLEFLFLTAGAASPIFDIWEVNVGKGGVDRHKDLGAGLSNVA